MAISQITSNSIAAGAVSASDLADGSVEAVKLASGAALSNLGSAQLADANMSPGSVIQVVQTVNNTLATYSRGNYITYLETAITPRATSSKILVCVNFGAWSSGQAADCGIIIYRDTTPLGQGSGGGTNVTFIPFMNQGSGDAFSSSFMYLDSPSTTSAIAYKFQQYGNSGSTFYYNRRGVGTDYACSSSVILMEIAG